MGGREIMFTQGGPGIADPDEISDDWVEARATIEAARTATATRTTRWARPTTG
jgi:hypothetical protein